MVITEMNARRLIKSDIWQDEWFGELTILEKLVWIGLFSGCADSQGRLLDNPRLICSKLFPFGDVTVDEVAECLNKFSEKIIRYRVDGRNYIQIIKWWENQPVQYAVPSNYPAPEGWKDRVKTYYKKIRIVYNWNKEPNTPAGEALMATLKNLGRVSNWVDYIGVLDYDTDTDYDYDYDTDTDIVVEGQNSKNSKTTSTSTTSSSPPSNDYILRVWCKVTGMVAIPSGQIDKVIPALEALYYKHNRDEPALVEYLKPFYAAWISRRTRDNRPYSKANCTWLYDWAVTGEIPEIGNGDNHRPLTPIERTLAAAKEAMDEALAEEAENGYKT